MRIPDVRGFPLRIKIIRETERDSRVVRLHQKPTQMENTFGEDVCTLKQNQLPHFMSALS